MEDTTSIFDLGYSCEAMFCQSISDLRLAAARSRLEELHQRFGAWVSYLGALAPGHASLDHRLRLSTEVRSMVVELLLLLRRNLSTVLDLRTTDLATPLQALRGGVDRLYQVGVAIRKSSTVGLSSRIQAFSAKHDDEDYFFSLALEIVRWKFPDASDAICSHMATTIKFRRQQILYQRRHQSKLRSAARLAEEQTPLAPKTTLLPQGSQAVAGQLEQHDATGIRTVVQAPSQTSASTFLVRDFLRHLNAPASVHSDVPKAEPLTAPSIRSSGSTVIEHGSLPFPQPPALQDGTSASCVWCFQEHTSKQYRSASWWRGHVMSCLQPLACLSEECKEPPRLFSSTDDWLSHMTEAHGEGWPQEVYKPIQWFCDVDHEEPLYFPRDQELAQHLRTTHTGTFTEAQIPTLLSQNTLSGTRDRHVCPLCNCVPDQLNRLIAANLDSKVTKRRIPKLMHRLTPAGMSKKNDIPGSTSFRATRFAGDQRPDEAPISAPLPSGDPLSMRSRFSKELERHVARHLRSIAFISIRNLDSEDDASSNASTQGGRSSRPDDEASESSLLVFQDVPPEERERTDVYTDEPPVDVDTGLPPDRLEPIDEIYRTTGDLKSVRAPHFAARPVVGVSFEQGQRDQVPPVGNFSRPTKEAVTTTTKESRPRRRSFPIIGGFTESYIGESHPWTEPPADAGLPQSAQALLRAADMVAASGAIGITYSGADKERETKRDRRSGALIPPTEESTPRRNPLPVIGGLSESYTGGSHPWTEPPIDARPPRSTDALQRATDAVAGISRPVKNPTARRNPLPTIGGIVRGAVNSVLSFWETEMDVAVLGLQGCGKTSLLRILAGEFGIDHDTIATVGFNMKRVKRGRTTIKFWDLGGQPRFRHLWERYCRGVNGIVFVVDISDRELMPQAKEELHALMGHPATAGIPLLVLGNYASRHNRLSVDELIAVLKLKEIARREVSCYGIDAKEETNLDAVVYWIMRQWS